MACQMIPRPPVLRNLQPEGGDRAGQGAENLCACRAVFSATLLLRIPHSISYYHVMTYAVPVVVSVAAATGGRLRPGVQAEPASHPMNHP